MLAVVLAPACAACGLPLEHPTHGPICEGCWDSVLPITPPVCDQCGDPLPSWRATSIDLARCPRCRRTSREIDRARAVGEYQGALRAIVHALKYDGRRSLARPLAGLMRERGADILDGAAAVVPVPLHHTRRRERGFNQALDLATRLDVSVCRALTRTRATSAQASLPASQRHGNVRDAFSVTWHVQRIVGHAVVLVDDVSTTGATMEACARELKRAGVREVRALTAARVVTARP